MTNQTIPPCPVCGNVPPACENYPDHVLPYKSCTCKSREPIRYDANLWESICNIELGCALRASGITTIAQLNDRLAPDPRVAVLDRIGAVSSVEVEFLWYLSNYAVDNGTMEDGLNFKAKREQLIAAQRGEGAND